MNICICDDNLESMKQIVNTTRSFFDKNNLEEISISQFSPKELKDLLNSKKFPFSIAILDIQLKETFNGINAGKIINRINPDCKIIFITNFPEFNTDAYDAQHIYSIPKMSMKTYLPKALIKATAQILQFSSGSLLIKPKGKIIRILYEDIIFFEQNSHKTIIHAKNNTYSINNKISNILKTIETIPPRFLLVHKSFIVNLQYVEEFSRKSLTLTGGITIPISRSHYLEVRNIFLTYLTDKLL